MNTKLKEMDLTTFMLHYCYTCKDAHQCDTERKCLECFEAKRAEVDKKQEADPTTKQLFTYYAL